MEIHELRTFLAIAEQGSVSAAARSTHTTQPAISRRLAKLEKGLGQELFARHSHGVELTAAGTTLLSEAQLFLGRVDALVDRLKSDTADLRRTLRVACPAQARIPMTRIVVAAYQAAHPNVKVELVATKAPSPTAPAGFDSVAELARTRDSGLDAALWITDSAPDSLQAYDALTEEVVLWASERTELADVTSVDEVLPLPFANPEHALDFVSHLYLADYRNGAKPRLNHDRVESRLDFWRSVHEGRAVACVPASTDLSHTPNGDLLRLRRIEFSEPLTTHSGVLIRRDDMRQHVRNFGEIAVAVAAQFGDLNTRDLNASLTRTTTPSVDSSDVEQPALALA